MPGKEGGHVLLVSSIAAIVRPGARRQQKESTREPCFSLSGEYVLRRTSLISYEMGALTRGNQKLGCDEREVADGLKIMHLKDTQVLFCFVNEAQAVTILQGGRRLGGNFLKLERWMAQDGGVMLTQDSSATG